MRAHPEVFYPEYNEATHQQLVFLTHQQLKKGCHTFYPFIVI